MKDNQETDSYLNSNSAKVFIDTEPTGWRAVLEFVLELVKVTAVCAIVIIMIRWFLFQPFYVKGSSMEPNFYEGEYLIIYQLPYRFPGRFNAFKEGDRGKALILHPPNDPKEFYIKRLIGLPGERIKIENGKIKIYNAATPNGFLLDESYLPKGLNTLQGRYDDVQLSLDEVYVLGDNRGYSLDSRRIGPIPIKNVIGTPVVRGWPFDRAGLIKNPKY